MVEAIATGSDDVLPVCAWTTGQYGIEGVYVGSRGCRGGVERMVELS
jgi:malate dehydrogenase